MSARIFLLFAVAASAARADVGARLTLSSMFFTESSDKVGADADAGNNSLGYLDLRGIVEAQRLPYGIEARGDFRLRLTGNVDDAAALLGQPQVTARGYSGGREYDLRELFVARRGATVDAALGRMIVRESDALTVDGARVWWRPTPAWHLSLFGGFYPNPYARSLPDDYTSQGLALAAGADAAYHYPRIWGSASLAGSYLGGPDDGGPINALSPAAPAGRTETPRVYLTWTNFLRVSDGISLFHDLVVDVAGAAGAQLTRLDLGGHFEWSRLRIDAAYDHFSSLAVELYLQRLLQFYDRRNWLMGTIENNLVIQRTARDEGRLRASVRIARLDVYGTATVRRRALLDAADDPNFAGLGPDYAFDVTVGARDDGDLFGFRLAAAFTEISGYRAETRLVTAGAGRDFFDERLGVDLTYGYEANRDFHNGAAPACTTLGPAPGGLATNCFGTRTGSVIEGGASVTFRPAQRWFFLVDYLLVYDTTDGGQAILSHVGFLRAEVRL